MYETKPYFYGTGRRKDSVARVRVYTGTGKITINDRDIDNYFGLETLKLIVRSPLVLLGALAYFVLTLAVNRRTPASPDTRYTAENGISVYYESAVWPVCEMTEDATLGRALELASAQSSDDANYQVVLFQKGTKDTYEDFIGQSEKELKQAYGVISPRKVNLNIDGAAVTAVRCDIQAYYAVLATIEYGNGDVIYVSGLTKLASISDIVNLVESVSLS